MAIPSPFISILLLVMTGAVLGIAVEVVRLAHGPDQICETAGSGSNVATTKQRCAWRFRECDTVSDYRIVE